MICCVSGLDSSDNSKSSRLDITGLKKGRNSRTEKLTQQYNKQRQGFQCQ